MTFTTDRRSLLIGATAFGAAATFGLPSFASTPKKGGTFRIGLSDSSTEDSLDPQRADSKFEVTLNWQLRNNLIEEGPGGVLAPELATEWEGSDDAKTWVFKIREGVEFHNGKSLTAADVVYSLNRHRGEDSTSDAKSLLTDITDISATGPHELTVTLAGPNSSLPSLMTISNLTIVPDGETDFAAGVGTGPYILESWEPGVKSRAVRNPNYWKEGRAHFDSVEILAIKDGTARTTALQTGEIHAMNAVDPATAGLLKAVPTVELIQTQGKVHYCFTMMTTDPAFQDVRMRKAMKLAINRQDILDKVLSGFGSIANDQPISGAYPNYNADIEQHEYDPDQAKSLAKAAGYDGAKLVLHASNTPFTGAVDAAQLYSEHAAAAGINIEPAREPEDGYWSNIWGKRPFFASRWSGRANEDLMLTLAYSQAALGGYNASAWDNQPFNDALIAARGETDDAKRKQMLGDCQQILHDDAGLVAPVWADFLDARSSKVATPDALGSNWELDGAKASERWWFA